MFELRKNRKGTEIVIPMINEEKRVYYGSAVA